MKISRHGISVDLPGGWEGKIYRREDGRPIVHLGNFALPPKDADFGTRAAESLGGGGAFALLAEYDASLAGQGLFATAGLPLPLRAADANPKAMPRRLPGRAGIQAFFTEEGRAFCLYVIVAAGRTAAAIHDLNEVLATVEISPERA